MPKKSLTEITTEIIPSSNVVLSEIALSLKFRARFFQKPLCRGVSRTLSNIHGKAFLQILLTVDHFLDHFLK